MQEKMTFLTLACDITHSFCFMIHTCLVENVAVDRTATRYKPNQPTPKRQFSYPQKLRAGGEYKKLHRIFEQQSKAYIHRNV